MGLNTLYRQYFGEVAMSHAALGAGTSDKHFALASYMAFNNEIRNKLEWPALVLEPADLKIDGPNEGQIMQTWTGAFGIYFNRDSRNTTFAEQDDIMDQSLTIMNQVLAKMKEDAQEGPLHYLLKFFEVRSASLLQVIEPDYLGYRVEFEFGHPFDYAVDPALWL